MSVPFLNVLILGGLLIVGIFILVRTYSRHAIDVLEDLRDEDLKLKDILDARTSSEKSFNSKTSNQTLNPFQINFSDDLGKAGIFEAEDRRRMTVIQNLMPIIGGMLLITPSLLGMVKSGAITFTLVSMGLGIGLVVKRTILRSLRKKYLRGITFFLPVVMERIVMAVQAGLDIVPAIKTATEFGGEGKNTDPVTRLLRLVVKLTESGMSFESSLKEVASSSESSALRHAFLHLAVAQKEGGVLIMPLRELSDSTQLYYQESIEEEIAEMPVKATMPLICTFAGLLLCFLVPPFLQVITILTENMPGGR